MHATQTIGLIQGAYYAVTGIWPVVHYRSFAAVTGPKRDVWLVRTVGLVVLGIGIAVGLAGWRGHVTLEIAILAIYSAAALAAVDIIYVLRRVIPPVYLLDGCAELVLIGAWAAAYFSQKSGIPSY